MIFSIFSILLATFSLIIAAPTPPSDAQLLPRQSTCTPGTYQCSGSEIQVCGYNAAWGLSWELAADCGSSMHCDGSSGTYVCTPN
ncbi:uncharacterized protein PAC_09399 [Phialocephala subalpina]|uniref:Uncharacterized protein n=1 Tax=Phialocephala subalpina TaxID=576137 RepID=A0A1L7X3E8_9HELO|nr:uncharacterized protein PAC_09399 [Phialocephala subalpina]